MKYIYLCLFVTGFSISVIAAEPNKLKAEKSKVTASSITVRGQNSVSLNKGSLEAQDHNSARSNKGSIKAPDVKENTLDSSTIKPKKGRNPQTGG